jgi:hypothetical protein
LESMAGGSGQRCSVEAGEGGRTAATPQIAREGASPYNPAPSLL